VVVKIPRFAFEKFPGADPELTTTMKSGRRGDEPGAQLRRGAQQGDALDGDESKRFWTLPDPGAGRRCDPPGSLEDTLAALRVPHDGRLYTVERALRLGATVEQVHEATGGIDPWFLEEIQALVDLRSEILDAPVLDVALLRRAKRSGLSDRQLAALRPELAGEDGVRTLRHRLSVRPVYKTVDTCAAEFAADTPYHYSSYDDETEVAPSDRPKVLILGSGPNRIGQGIEFDYSCVHAVMALRAAGYETVMVNCNPETVSTDYDTADRLYFEPLTFEDVLEVVHAEDSTGRAAGGPGVVGVIVQLGGQTPLGLANRLKAAGVPIVGTSPESIDMAEDRGLFGALLAGPSCVHRTTAPPRRSTRPRPSPTRSAIRCWCGRRTCSAAGAWRSCTTSRR
jgi:carbamoyl-phosphate synthase large subunit